MNTSDSKEQSQESTTVEIVEAESEKKAEVEPEKKSEEKSEDKKQEQEEIKVVELNPAGQGESKILKDYYWGVGVSGVYITLSNGSQGYKVTEVYAGYSADNAGILVGDLIYSVNGGSVGLNDIMGKTPAHLILGIVRGSLTLIINLDRVQVYY